MTVATLCPCGAPACPDAAAARVRERRLERHPFLKTVLGSPQQLDLSTVHNVAPVGISQEVPDSKVAPRTCSGIGRRPWKPLERRSARAGLAARLAPAWGLGGRWTGAPDGARAARAPARMAGVGSTAAPRRESQSPTWAVGGRHPRWRLPRAREGAAPAQRVWRGPARRPRIACPPL